ncbi:MAG TPA: winged helix-turn-helix domain-containing protein [Phototrophicaceae bacterium]|nr:winged helix-turn-helix domain-containing protein [Phototrophicaceae bacterium]HYZ96228.1 winged helix-turn-helix domain-containing protein [Nitrososphaeraceae archaeon]
MKNRSRLEIIAMILETIGDSGAIQAKIMYKVYLSFLQMKEYLSQIMQHGLIIYDDRAQIYKITDKGRRFLALYKQMTESITMTKPIL